LVLHAESHPRPFDEILWLTVQHRIHSLNNPQLKRLKRLHRVRSDQREFLLEGTHLVMEAIAAQWPLESLFMTDAWLAAHPRCLEHLPVDVERYAVDARWLEQAATTEHPDGIVAVARISEERLPMFSEDPNDWRLTVALDGVQDPGNAGTILRVAVATGVDRVFLSPDSVNPIHPKFLRSTAGQWFRSPPRAVAMGELIPFAKRMGVRVLAASLQGDAIWNIDLTVPTLFLLGNEGSGVRPETQRLADGACTVPMVAGVESLNVATAGTILLYEAMRQRRRPSHPPQGAASPPVAG
jgi:TrmH family RNA methyltransferase